MPLSTATVCTKENDWERISPANGPHQGETTPVLQMVFVDITTISLKNSKYFVKYNDQFKNACTNDFVDITISLKIHVQMILLI